MPEENFSSLRSESKINLFAIGRELLGEKELLLKEFPGNLRDCSFGDVKTPSNLNPIDRFVLADDIKDMQSGHAQTFKEVGPALPFLLYKLQQTFLIISLLSLPDLDHEMNDLVTEPKILLNRLIFIFCWFDGCQGVVPPLIDKLANDWDLPLLYQN